MYIEQSDLIIIFSFYAENGGQSVLVALGITAGVTIGVTIFSIQTRFDFTGCGGFLFVASWGLFLFGFIAIFTYSQVSVEFFLTGKHGGLVERNTLHDQKVMGSNPARAIVLHPLARCFISSCFTPPIGVKIGSCYRGNHDLGWLRVHAH